MTRRKIEKLPQSSIVNNLVIVARRKAIKSYISPNDYYRCSHSPDMSSYKDILAGSLLEAAHIYAVGFANKPKDIYILLADELENPNIQPICITLSFPKKRYKFKTPPKNKR